MNWEPRLILITLLAAAVSAAPLNLVNSAVPYAHGVAAVAYAAAAPVPYPAALTYAVPEPVANAVQPQITYDFRRFFYDFPVPVSAPAPSPVAVAVPAPVKVGYDFPAPISAPAPAPVVSVAAPVVYAAPAPVQIAAAPVHVFPQAFETRVHYTETPVVNSPTYDFPAQIAKLAPSPVKVEYDILGPIAAPAPAPVIRVAAPVKVEYIFPPRISAPAPAPVIPAVIMMVAAPVALPAAGYDFLAPISAPAPAPVVVAAPAPITYAAPAPVKVEYDFPAPISAPAPAPVVQVAAPVKVEYDFPAPISAPAPAPVPVAVAAPAPITYAAPAPVAYAAPAPVQIAAAPVHVVPQAFETRVHYAETPVVVGHTSTIMKPNLGAGAHVTNFDFMGLAQTKTVGQESFVQKSKVLAPARTVSEITPQVTVQHPTKVNVEKFAVEVPVAAPYAQPVPVPIAP